MVKTIFIFIVVSLLLASPLLAANDRTGFDVVIESYGFQLVSYDITSKFTFKDDKFVAMEIVITDGTDNYNLYWIMKKERYNELKEKV